jgi:Restriction endonuclease S subunits
LPFEIPDNWIWCKLSDVGQIIGGGTPSTKEPSYWDNGTIAWITPADLSNYCGKYIASGSRNITKGGLEKSSAQLMPAGTILFSSRAPVGYIAIAANEICTNQGFKSLVPFVLEINEFIYYYLTARVEEIQSRASGTTFKEISGSEFGNTLIAFPPLIEQSRIVASIESTFAIIDEIEQNKIDLHAVIIETKSKILSLAIQGKLVSQDPNDEPASVLLERIRSEKESLIKAGKIKRSKSDSVIIRGDDNCYYGGLPEIWTICNLGDLVKVIGGVSYDKKDVNLNGIRILRGGNIQEEKILFFDDDVFLPQQYFDMEKVVQSTDIVIVASTGSKVVIGKAGFLKSQSEQIQIGAFLRIIRPIKEETAKYIQTIFRTDEYRMYIREISKGTNINNIKSKYINDFIIPLPPLAEQHRIVNAIETAFEQIDNIVKAIE